MPEKNFEYKEGESGIFGRIKRPLIDIEVEDYNGKWLKLKNVLVDTGADVSILPRDLGEMIVSDITQGKIIEIKGIVPYARLIVYVHNIKYRISDFTFVTPTAIADSNDVIPILGRTKGIDLFNAIFKKGRNLSLQWE